MDIVYLLLENNEILMWFVLGICVAVTPKCVAIIWKIRRRPRRCQRTMEERNAAILIMKCSG